jgi:hypothetical protein
LEGQQGRLPPLTIGEIQGISAATDTHQTFDIAAPATPADPIDRAGVFAWARRCAFVEA